MRATWDHLCVYFATAVVLVSCGGDGTAPELEQSTLEISSVWPLAGAADTETGTIVSVTFDRSIDATTLTDGTFRVTAGGVTLPAVIRYDTGTRTATALVPLLPGEAYQVEVTTGVRTSTDIGLSTTERWSFTTREWEVAALADPGAYTSLTADGSGRLHVSYWIPGGSLGYGTCTGACTVAANWDLVTVAGGSGVYSSTSLALGPSGQLHVIYHDRTRLKYATCAASCTTAESWDTLTVAYPLQEASQYLSDLGPYTSLAVDGDGRLHAAYWNVSLFHATCATSCASADNWQWGAALDLDTYGGLHTALTVDESGRAHVGYRPYGDDDGLRYASCTDFGGSGICAQSIGNISWPQRTVSSLGGSYVSIAVDATGGVHMSHWDSTNVSLEYAVCEGGCTAADAWAGTTLDTSADRHSSVGVDSNGRLHLVYRAEGALRYTTCVADCLSAANWRTAPIQGSGGEWVSLTMDGNGQPHMTFYGGGPLTYVR